MRASTKKPAPLAAARASKAFCVVAERSEDSQIPAVNQASILGIDIGSKGAIAVRRQTASCSMPSKCRALTMATAGRRNVNGPLLAEIIAKAHASSAYVELVGARPGEGAVGAFPFGRSRGVAEGVIAALGIRVTHISPASWKRAIGIPVGREGAKDAARSEALRRWPNKAALFTRKCDEGKAEAALIAVAALSREAAR